MRGGISKEQVKSWLENYQALAAGDTIPDVVCNSGPKEYDNISVGFLNKIILDSAIALLPGDHKRCVLYRWVFRLPLKMCLEQTKLDKSKYYRTCDKAVQLIYEAVNGRNLNYYKFFTRTLDTL